MEQNIEIAVRIKPIQHAFISPLYYWDSQSIQIADKNTFSYDYVLPPNATQQEVFQKIGLKIISNVLQGYNGCIFAYGQTGSGKTYTMTGYDQQEGIIQKCLKTLWNCVNKSQFSQIKLSYFQIYNQTIKDLLNDKQNLTIRENVKSGFYIQGLAERVIEKYDDFQELIQHGISVRTVKQTKMNQNSSRSHSVLQVNVAYKKSQQRGLNVLKHAKITFIDLAGSQKQKQTQVQGQRLKQAANINKSLSNLSLVISKLSEISQKKSSNQSNQSTAHVPYRNSVLTKILKNSLTGKSKIIIICTISLDERFIDETLSTLRFAQTAKSIKMKVKKNEQEFDGTRERLFQQFQEFKTRYNELKEQFQQSQKSNESLKRQNAILKDQIQKKQAELNDLQINYECLKIQSNQIVRQIRSQLINPQMSQESVYQPVKRSQNMSRSQTQFKSKDNNQWSQKSSAFREASFDGRCYDTNSQNFFNPIMQPSSNPTIQPSSQLSFFTTNLSSQFSTPRKTFFTIDQADEKQEIDNNSSEFFKIQQKIKYLQKEVHKYEIEREFFMMNLNLKQEQIKEVTKRNVFLEMKEKQIQDGHDLFAEMIRNKQFTHAQLNFLKLCLEKSKKDRMAFQLIQQEKNSQKTRFFQNNEKVKQILLKHAYGIDNNQMINFNEGFSNMSFSKSGAKSQQTKRFSQNLNRQKIETYSVKIGVSQKQKKQNGFESNNLLFSNSKSRIGQDLCDQQVEFRGQNIKQVSQVQMMYGRSQTMGMMSNLMQRSSQIPLFLTQNRSMMSQSSLRFGNNELDYLKKDYDRVNQQLKNTRQQLDRKNIMLMEKESLLIEKQMQFQQLVDRNQKLIQDIIAQNEIREIQKKKKRTSSEFQSIQKQLNEKQNELKHLRKHLEDTFKKHQQQINSLKLQKKALQVSADRQQQMIDNLNNRIQLTRQRQIKQGEANEKLIQQTKRLRQQYKNLQIDKGFLDSQNQLLNQKYNQLKVIVKNYNKVQTPKKVYKQRISFYSLSQSQSQSQFQSQQKINQFQSQQKMTQIQSQQKIIQSSISQTIKHKSTQMTEEQCIKVIETKRHEDMYIAAYHFYKMTEKLHDIKESLQKKLNQSKSQLMKMNLKMKQLQEQRQMAIQKFIQSQNKYLSNKQLTVSTRQKQLEFKSQLFDKHQQIVNLQSTNKQLRNYCKTLQTKLLERQHKQFETRQKVNDLTTQIRENTNMPQTPINNNPNKGAFNLKRRISSSQSPDSLSSNSTVIRTSSYINGSRKSMENNHSRKSSSFHSRKSIEMPLNNRNDNEFDQTYDIFRQIQQVSNQQSKQEKDQSKSKSHFFQSSPSIPSKTVTNSSFRQGQRNSQRLVQTNQFHYQNSQSQIEEFEPEFYQIKNNSIKPTSIKSNSNLNEPYLFKQHKKNIFQKN